MEKKRAFDGPYVNWTELRKKKSELEDISIGSLETGKQREQRLTNKRICKMCGTTSHIRVTEMEKKERREQKKYLNNND